MRRLYADGSPSSEMPVMSHRCLQSQDSWGDGLGCGDAEGESSQDQEGKGEEPLVN